MTNIISKLSIWTGLLGICLLPTGLRAEGHHQSGIIGQAVVSLNAPLTGDRDTGLTTTFLRDPFWPIDCTVELNRLKGSDPKPLTFDGAWEFVASVPTDAEGHFKTPLKPGTYYLIPTRPPPPPDRPRMGNNETFPMLAGC